MGFLNLVILFGLAGAAIPLIIHLWHRRRYQVVDWGAMQFLHISSASRRRLMLEEILLMALRMGLIAILVLALAGPFLENSFLPGENGGRARDVVLIVDVSASMTLDDGRNPTPYQEAKTWMAGFLDHLPAGTRISILPARRPFRPLVSPTLELDRAQKNLEKLPAPAGTCDFPGAVEEGFRLLKSAGTFSHQDIIVLGDGLRFGWADPDTLGQWEALGTRLSSPETSGDAGIKPRIRVVHVGPDRKKPLGNYSLAPILPGRNLAWTGQQIKFQSALRLAGAKELPPPRRVRLEIDGRPIKDLPIPEKLSAPILPLVFAHRFDRPGSHLVSLIVEPEVRKKDRPENYQIRDCLPPDNRQDLALEVMDSLPVLVVDGSGKKPPENSSYFLVRAMALSPAPKRPPVMNVRLVTPEQFSPAMLLKEGIRPLVLVLANVPRLTDSQETAVRVFLEKGGGVLVVLGNEVRADHYNDILFQDGRGWLPARLDQPTGDPGKIDRAARPDESRMTHPALDMFRGQSGGTFGLAHFPRWWKVTVPKKSKVAATALLSTGDPWLVEKDFHAGRTLLCTVPLDRSWNSNLPTLWEFPVLIHELVFYLAGGRANEGNLVPGQPLRILPKEKKEQTPAQLVLHLPDGETRALKADHWPLFFEETYQPGIYRLEKQDGNNHYFVVQADPRESDLTPLSDEDRQKVAQWIPMKYQEGGDIAEDDGFASPPPQEIWWILLIAVILFLCAETWLTRRLALANEGVKG